MIIIQCFAFAALVYYLLTISSDYRRYMSKKQFFHQQVCLILQEIEVSLHERNAFEYQKKTAVFKKNALNILRNMHKMEKENPDSIFFKIFKLSYRDNRYRIFAYSCVLYIEYNLRADYHTDILSDAVEYAIVNLKKYDDYALSVKCINEYYSLTKKIDEILAKRESYNNSSFELTDYLENWMHR